MRRYFFPYAVNGSFHDIGQLPFFDSRIPPDGFCPQVIDAFVVFYPVQKEIRRCFRSRIISFHSNESIRVDPLVITAGAKKILLVLIILVFIEVFALKIGLDEISLWYPVATAKPK